jgi:hypothetical protein
MMPIPFAAYAAEKSGKVGIESTSLPPLHSGSRDCRHKVDLKRDGSREPERPKPMFVRARNEERAHAAPLKNLAP